MMKRRLGPAACFGLLVAACSHAPTPRTAAGGDGRAPARAEAGVAASPPAWLSGEDPRFPRRRVLCAVGHGPQPTAAQDAALGALGRIFGARVVTSSRDRARLQAGHDAPERLLQEADHQVAVDADTRLEGAEIAASWSPPGGEAAALACLARGPAADRLTLRAAQADGLAASLLQAATQPPLAGSPWRALCALEAARVALDRRDLALSQCAVVRAQGAWPEAEAAASAASGTSRAQLDAARRAAGQRLRVRLVLIGSQGDDPRTLPLRAALGQVLAEAGLPASALGADAGAYAGAGPGPSAKAVADGGPPAAPSPGELTVAGDLEDHRVGTIDVAGTPMVLVRAAVHLRLLADSGPAAAGPEAGVVASFSVAHQAGGTGEAAARQRLWAELAPRAAAQLRAQLEAAWRPATAGPSAGGPKP